MRISRFLAPLFAVAALLLGGLVVAAPAQAGGCTPTHTGELGDGTPIYFGCTAPYRPLVKPPFYAQSAPVAFRLAR